MRWPMNGETTRARSWRSMPPVSLPPSSPPTMTAVPFEVSALRRRETDGLPAMSMITSYVVLPSAKSSRA